METKVPSHPSTHNYLNVSNKYIVVINVVKRINITISEDVYEKLKQKNLKMSPIAQKAFERAIKKEGKSIDELPAEEQENIVAVLDEQMNKLDGQVNYLQNKFSVDVTKDELKEWYEKTGKTKYPSASRYKWIKLDDREERLKNRRGKKNEQ